MVAAQSHTTVNLKPFFDAWIFATVAPARTAASRFSTSLPRATSTPNHAGSFEPIGFEPFVTAESLAANGRFGGGWCSMLTLGRAFRTGGAL